LHRTIDNRTAVRWIAVTLGAVVAVAIAVWTGLEDRPPEQPESTAKPADRAVEVCARRLAAVGLALAAYAQDHDGFYPVTTTPAATYNELLPVLASYGVSERELLCPVSERTGGPFYVYHSYLRRGDIEWPKWMAEQHVVTGESPPDTWLMADALIKDDPGPHSETQKAFNYLCVDGSVHFRSGAPRMVYK